MIINFLGFPSGGQTIFGDEIQRMPIYFMRLVLLFFFLKKSCGRVYFRVNYSVIFKDLEVGDFSYLHKF
jgi:hypothetical protein